MSNIIIKSAGNDKEKVIAEYKLRSLLSLEEAKNAVDGLEEGKEIVIPMEGVSQELIDRVIKRFTDIGAWAYEEKLKIEENSFAKAMKGTVERKDSEKTELGNGEHKTVANAGTLDRETTMQKLIEVGKVAKKLEELSVAKGRVTSDIIYHKRQVEEIRHYVSKNPRLWIGPIILIFMTAQTFVLLPVGVIIGIIWYLLMSKKYKEKYLQEHAEENNSNAEKYIAENIAPLEAELEDVYNQISDLHESGKVAEAVDFVGEDMFAYGCIEDLYNLIKSRKADNLKEALNLYDDSMYKARMEEMQLAIQNASEVAAIEAAKQTALTKDIAKNTHQTATAARATAYHTRWVEKNTRQFRRK